MNANGHLTRGGGNVWSRDEVMQIDPEPVWVVGPGVTVGLKRGRPTERLEVLGEIVGCDEDQDMRSQALQIVVVKDLYGRILDRAVHALGPSS
jgi:hypothetical protein